MGTHARPILGTSSPGLMLSPGRTLLSAGLLLLAGACGTVPVEEASPPHILPPAPMVEVRAVRSAAPDAPPRTAHRPAQPPIAPAATAPPFVADADTHRRAGAAAELAGDFAAAADSYRRARDLPLPLAQRRRDHAAVMRCEDLAYRFARIERLLEAGDRSAACRAHRSLLHRHPDLSIHLLAPFAGLGGEEPGQDGAR